MVKEELYPNLTDDYWINVKEQDVFHNVFWMDENGSPNNPAMRAFIKEGVITGKDAEKLQHTFTTLIRRYLRLRKHKEEPLLKEKSPHGLKEHQESNSPAITFYFYIGLSYGNRKTKSDFEQAYVVEAETFRDSVGTMDNTGKRKWVFPRKPKGKYTNYRNIVSTLLLIVFLFYHS